MSPYSCHMRHLYVDMDRTVHMGNAFVLCTYETICISNRSFCLRRRRLAFEFQYLSHIRVSPCTKIIPRLYLVIVE